MITLPCCGALRSLGPHLRSRALSAAAQVAGSSRPYDKGFVHSRTRQWLEEYVVALNLCPFASSALTGGGLSIEVVSSDRLSDCQDAVLRAADKLVKIDHNDNNDGGDGTAKTTVLAVPNISELDDLGEYLSMVNHIEGALSEKGYDGVLQVATFHPKYQFAGSDEDAVENFTNRSPWPLFHLLREQDVGAAVDSFGGETDSIWQTNEKTMRRIGHERLLEMTAVTRNPDGDGEGKGREGAGAGVV